MEEQTQSLFERGDKVRLKTGGPVMTVEAAPDHMAYCVWFVDNKTHEGTFAQHKLLLIRSATSSDSRF